MRKQFVVLFVFLTVVFLIFSSFVSLPISLFGYSKELKGNVLFEDNFSNGLYAWKLFGDPKPVIDYNFGNPAPSFNNNGDCNYASGALTTEEFNLAGTVLEGDIYIAAHPNDCWTACSIGFAKSDTNYSDTEWPGYAVGIGYRYDGDACWATPSQYREHGALSFWLIASDGTNQNQLWRPEDSYLNAWHHYKIEITQDRYVKFYIDGNLVYSPTAKLGSQFVREPILLGTRSYDGDSLIDNIKLSTIGGTGTFNSDIWVDKGCGATYSDNESIEVYFKSDKSGSAYILDYETDGNTEKFGPWNISAGKTYNLSGTVSGPDGTETLELHVKAPDGSLSVSSCEFYIENTAPSEVNVKLWLDKGCGATYCVGDAPRAYFEVDQDVPISMFEYMPDGTMKTIIDHQKCEANVEYYVDGKASYPLGKRTLKIEAYCPNDMETVIGSATCSFTVKDCKAKLNLTKVVDKSSAKVNDILTYTITYSNDGNSNATGIKVADAIPYGTKYISGSAEFIDIPSSSHSILFSHNDGGSYDNSDSLPVTNVKWTTSSLSPGTSIRVRFKVKIVKDSDFTIKNTANLIADNLDLPITASSTTEVYKTKPPSAPTLTAMPGDSKVTLTWTTPSQGTFPIAGYKIYRGSCSGGESNNPIATVNYGENKYVDQRVVNGKTYYYYIKAFDNQSPPNYSDPSNEVMAVPQSLTPPPDTTNTKDLDGDGKKDLSAGTTNNWVEVKTAHTSSVISSAGVQSDKKEVIKDVSTNKKLAGLKLISTSSPRILKNDSDYLIYEVDKFYEGYSGKSAIIRWTTIIPKNDDYWIFFAQMENTGYSPIDLSNNPNLLKTEIVSPERFIVSGVSEEDVSSLYNGESFYPKKNETLMIEYNSDTVAAMGYMAPWTSPVNKFEVGDNKGINTVVSNDIIQPNQVALWQGILVVDTTAHVLSYLPDKPLLQTLHRKVSPEVMDGYILDAIKEIFNNAQDNELSILAQVGKAISGFTDIKRTVADGAMVLLNKFGIISGYGNGILKPQRSLSRAEFAKIIDKAMGFDTSKPSHPHFKDVSPSDWYYEFVETAYDNGVVHGYPDGTFRPNNIITKTETVTVIDNLLNLYYYGKEKTFVDVYRSFWGYKYIEAAYNKSIIVLQFPIVDPTGPYFKPNNPASRRVASYFVVQAMKYRSLNE